VLCVAVPNFLFLDQARHHADEIAGLLFFEQQVGHIVQHGGLAVVVDRRRVHQGVMQVRVELGRPPDGRRHVSRDRNRQVRMPTGAALQIAEVLRCRVRLDDLHRVGRAPSTGRGDLIDAVRSQALGIGHQADAAPPDRRRTRRSAAGGEQGHEGQHDVAMGSSQRSAGRRRRLQS